MTELEMLIMKECSAAAKPKEYEVSIEGVFGGAKMRLHPVCTAEYYDIVARCTHDGVLDAIEMQTEMIAAALIDPCINSVELQNALHVTGAKQVVQRLFPKPGIVRLLRDKIEEVSGFGDVQVTFREC